jgi:primosomal protein N' (replication factor Y)
MGPAPATILKVAKRYRWQMMLKFPEAQVGEPLAWELPLVELQRRCPKEIRLGIDVDPLHLL